MELAIYSFLLLRPQAVSSLERSIFLFVYSAPTQPHVAKVEDGEIDVNIIGRALFQTLRFGC